MNKERILRPRLRLHCGYWCGVAALKGDHKVISVECSYNINTYTAEDRMSHAGRVHVRAGRCCIIPTGLYKQVWGRASDQIIFGLLGKFLWTTSALPVPSPIRTSCIAQTFLNDTASSTPTYSLHFAPSFVSFSPDLLYSYTTGHLRSQHPSTYRQRLPHPHKCLTYERLLFAAFLPSQPLHGPRHLSVLLMRRMYQL